MGCAGSKSNVLIAATVAVRHTPTFIIDTDHLRSPRDPGKEIKIVVWNPGSLTVDLYHVGADGRETLLQSFDPDYDTDVVDTNVDAVLRTRERETQHEVNLFIVSDDQYRHYMVDSSTFAGSPQTELEIYNDTGLSIDVFRRYEDRNGNLAERYHQTIQPYNFGLQSTYAKHQWVFRDNHSGYQVGSRIKYHDGESWVAGVLRSDNPVVMVLDDRTKIEVSGRVFHEAVGVGIVALAD